MQNILHEKWRLQRYNKLEEMIQVDWLSCRWQTTWNAILRVMQDVDYLWQTSESIYWEMYAILKSRNPGRQRTEGSQFRGSGPGSLAACDKYCILPLSLSVPEWGLWEHWANHGVSGCQMGQDVYSQSSLLKKQCWLVNRNSPFLSVESC